MSAESKRSSRRLVPDWWFRIISALLQRFRCQVLIRRSRKIDWKLKSAKLCVEQSTRRTMIVKVQKEVPSSCLHIPSILQIRSSRSRPWQWPGVGLRSRSPMRHLRRLICMPSESHIDQMDHSLQPSVAVKYKTNSVCWSSKWEKRP